MQENYMLNIIYDTLMGNTQNEQLDVESVTNQEVSQVSMSFDYKGKNIFIVVKESDLIIN